VQKITPQSTEFGEKLRFGSHGKKHPVYTQKLSIAEPWAEWTRLVSGGQASRSPFTEPQALTTWKRGWGKPRQPALRTEAKGKKDNDLQLSQDLKLKRGNRVARAAQKEEMPRLRAAWPCGPMQPSELEHSPQGASFQGCSKAPWAPCVWCHVGPP
jgi:hypothetical protein